MTVTITGHEIHIISHNGIEVTIENLDEEIYQINQAILDGYYNGEIFVESIKSTCSWKII